MTWCQNDMMAKWHDGKMALCQNDMMAKWHDGIITWWQNDMMLKWHDGMSLTPSACLSVCLYEHLSLSVCFSKELSTSHFVHLFIWGCQLVSLSLYMCCLPPSFPVSPSVRVCVCLYVHPSTKQVNIRSRSYLSSQCSLLRYTCWDATVDCHVRQVDIGNVESQKAKYVADEDEEKERVLQKLKKFLFHFQLSLVCAGNAGAF